MRTWDEARWCGKAGAELRFIPCVKKCSKLRPALKLAMDTITAIGNDAP